MAYQNDDRKNQVQTRGETFVCEKGVDTPILLLTSFQDDMLKLSFCGELPASQQTENKRFDRQNPTITCITREKCNCLAEAYEDEIMKMIRGEQPLEPKSVSITVANVNLVMLALDKDGNGAWQTHLKLIRGIDPETLKCDNITDFVFPKGEYILNYKPDDGSFSERKLVHNGIQVFYHDLKEFSYAATKAYVHAARCVDKAYKDMVYDGIVQLGHKLGVELKSYGNGTGNSRYGNSGSLFDNNGGSSSLSNNPTMTLDELERQLQDGGNGGFMNVPDVPDEELPF